MDTAEERGMSITDFAKALAKGMADRDRQHMQGKAGQPEINKNVANKEEELSQPTP